VRNILSKILPFLGILCPVFRNLGAYLKALKARGELLEIDEPVSAEIAITAFADRSFKTGGPALLFKNVKDKEIPLVIGLYGTPERTAFALGVEHLEELAQKVERLLALAPEPGLRGLAALLPKLKDFKGIFPKRVRQAPVQEVVHTGKDVDLGRLPVQKCWPKDAGPFITLPQVITKDPETGDLNVGMYRMQVVGRDKTLMHWQLHKTGRKHYEKAKALGKKLEVAVALGGDPVLAYAATAPLPELPGISEYHLAGFLRGRPVEWAPAKTVDLPVPAEAEIVLEGYVDPEEPLAVEGPFGDHTGFYTPPDRFPVFHVTAVTHRRRPVYPSTIVGVPPMEDAWLIEASERLFLPAAKNLLPELVDYHMPPPGVAHNWVNASIQKRYPGQAQKTAFALLGLGQMSLTKMLVVVDADVPVKPGFSALLKAVEKLHPRRDVLFLKGPLDELDHAPPQPAFGGKLVLDGTTKLPAEGGTPLPPATPGPVSHESLRRQAAWPGLLALTIEKTRPRQAREVAVAVLKDENARGTRLLLITEDRIDPKDPDALMWLVLANLDPARDAWIEEAPFGPVLVLDGTKKFPEEGHPRSWPEVAELPPETWERLKPLLQRYGLA